MIPSPGSRRMDICCDWSPAGPGALVVTDLLGWLRSLVKLSRSGVGGRCELMARFDSTTVTSQAANSLRKSIVMMPAVVGAEGVGEEVARTAWE